jgi:hypothetical protein
LWHGHGPRQVELRHRAAQLEAALCLGDAGAVELRTAVLALAERAGVDALIEGGRAYAPMRRSTCT